jgi:hypothetical protein
VQTWSTSERVQRTLTTISSKHLPDSMMHDGRTTDSRWWMNGYHHSMFLHRHFQS